MNPRYVVFDCLTFEEFETKTSLKTYHKRMEYLSELLKGQKHEPYLNIAERINIIDSKHLEKLKETAIKREWEGLIIRRDCLYEGKRTNNMLKIKQFQREEFKVLNIETGLFRIIKNNQEESITTMTSIIIQLDEEEHTCSVGSGFTLQMREDYFSNPSKIIGKYVCIQYFEKSSDKNGKPSLRFPTFVLNYEKKRDL